MATVREALVDARNFIAAEFAAHPRTNDSRYERLKDLLSHIDAALGTAERKAVAPSTAPEALPFPDAMTAFPDGKFSAADDLPGNY